MEERKNLNKRVHFHVDPVIADKPAHANMVLVACRALCSTQLRRLTGTFVARVNNIWLLAKTQTTVKITSHPPPWISQH